ncbi:MAG: Rieske 2Fe-2S domain-containing protein [Candidatus Baltobacteraceae bacterium]
MSMTRRASIATIATAIAGGLAADAFSFEYTEAAPSTEPRQKIGTLDELKAKGEIAFAYPDENSPARAVLLASGDVVAYSLICTHMGCEVAYTHETQTFTCPCHGSVFDAARSGEVERGPAPRPLPEIAVQSSPGGDLYAVGLSAPIFGRPESTEENQALYGTGGER